MLNSSEWGSHSQAYCNTWWATSLDNWSTFFTSVLNRCNVDANELSLLATRWCVSNTAQVLSRSPECQFMILLSNVILFIIICSPSASSSVSFLPSNKQFQLKRFEHNIIACIVIKHGQNFGKGNMFHSWNTCQWPYRTVWVRQSPHRESDPMPLVISTTKDMCCHTLVRWCRSNPMLLIFESSITLLISLLIQ